MKQILMKTRQMKNLFLMSLMMLMVGVSWGQTNNYFGTSGTISGSVWSTNSGGPYTSTLNTGGGAILNFNNTGSATGANISSTANTWNFGAPITWSAGGTVGSANTVITFNVSSGVLQDFGGSQSFSTSASAGFIKTGAGALSFTASAAYGGGFTLSNGTMVIRGINALGSGVVNLNGGTLAANANRSIITGSIVIGGNVQFGEISSNVSLAGVNNISFSSAVPVALGSSIRTLTLGNSASHSLLGTISGAGGLTFAANSNGSTGTFVLSSGNTYSGKTQLTGGIVSGSGESMFGANPVGFTADQITFNGGTLSASGSLAFSSNRGITLIGTSNTLNCNSNRITLTNEVTGSGGFTKTGAGGSGDTLLLSGVHTFTGAVTVANGYLKLNSSNIYPNTSALTISSGAFLDLKANSDTIGSLAGAGTVTSSLAGSVTITIGGNNTSTTFSGVAQNGNGTVSLTKYGSGTLTLTGANTYTGLTTVGDGTLRLNRSGGTTIPTTDSCTVTSGSLQISSNQTLRGLTLASGTTLTVDAGVTLTITGTLTVNTGATINGGGTIAYSGSGALVYNGSTSRTADIEWPTSSVPTSVTIGSTATVVLGSTRTTTTTLSVNGTLNASTFSITGAGTVNINGTLKTQNLSGFANPGTGGCTGCTFTGAITLSLGSTSTVEYNAASGTQIISTGPSYVRLTLSIGGTKTSASGLNISDSLTISGATIFYAGSGNIGGTGTKLTMTGTSRYIMSGTGVKPDATGVYNLGTGTTLEFTNTQSTLQTIRSITTPTYYNIDISGSNVGSTLVTGIKFLSGGTFNITSTGTFKFTNPKGFANQDSSAISTTNNPSITLQSGSTLDFNSNSGTQVVDARSDYRNLSISNAATKTMAGNITVGDTLRLTSSKLSIAGNTLTLNGYVSGMNPSNSLTSSNSSKLTVGSTSNVGTIYFDQTTSADVLTTNGTNALQNLVITGASGTITLGNKLNLFERLNVKNGSTLNTGDSLVLRSIAGSSSNNTAYVDSVGGTISGQVTVERYIHKSERGWRAITAPVTYNGVINNDKVINNWQSSFGYVNNYGTRITGPIATNGIEDVTPGSSLLTYNSTTGAWNKITNTNTETQSGNSITAANKGFFLFIRGDRTVIPNGSNPNPFVATTLASKGLLQTGTQIFNFTGTSNSYWLVGNPYACPVDMSAVTYNNIGDFVYVWDPNLAGSSPNTCGGYAAFDRTSWVTPATAGSSTKYFQSGQAFFIKPNSATASVQFTESNKATTQQNNQVTGIANGSTDIFNIKLLSVKTDGTRTEADGVRAKFGNGYSVNVDENDALKFTSSIENISLSRNGKLLVIEARPYITTTDTLFLNMTATSIGANYEFKVSPINFDASVNSCKLVDNFLNTETTISLNSNTIIGFNVTSVTGSNASNRFYIVFNTTGSLPTNNLNIKAYKKNNTVVVGWESVTENNVKHYSIEKSIDGNNFNKLATVTAKNNNMTNNYTLVDNTPNSVNYYRIKTINNNSNEKYSDIVKVEMNIKGVSISIYPNPVKGSTIGVQLNNIESGKYTVKLFNISGQEVWKSTIPHNGNNGIVNLQLNKKISAGNYELQLIDVKGNNYKEMVLVTE